MIDAAKAGLIRVIFPGRAGSVGQIVLRWAPTKTVRDYLTSGPLAPYQLMGKRKHCKLTNQRMEKVRFGSVLKAGDTIVMRRA